MSACGAGFVGERALAFERGAECLGALPADAACGPLTDCLQPPELDCPAFCARAAACEVPLADCADRCDADPLARNRIEACGALPLACEALAACAPPAFAPPDFEAFSPGLQVVCAAFNACYGQQLPGTCENLFPRLFQMNPSAAPCVLDALNGPCPPEPLAIADQCLMAEGAQYNPLTPGCADLCQARALCDDFAPGDHLVDCLNACVGAWDPFNPQVPQDLLADLACGVSFSCPDLAVCLAP